MKDYMITTDSTADLSDSYLIENKVESLFVPYLIEGKTFDKDSSLSIGEFYEKIKGGAMPTTSQINPEESKEGFLTLMKKYNSDLLHVAFSSGLSGTYNSARIAAMELEEEYTDHKVVVVDSLCASLGEGLLVDFVVRNKNLGMSLEENVAWIEENKHHIISDVIVDDLMYLERGGRVSKAAATVGTLIHLKPVLHMDEEGRLAPVAKVRGRRKSIAALVDSMEKKIGSFKDKNNAIFISHGDCEAEANALADMIKARLGFKYFYITHIGPTIGSHSGPGAIALFYMGETR
jgi:DegV family protein with EDD domain